MIKFDIYDKRHHSYIKTGCTMEAIIEAGHTLTDDEVRKYFGIDEDHKHWRRAHHPARVKRYVFDKCIVPETPNIMIEESHEEDI